MLKTGVGRGFIRKGEDPSSILGPVLEALKQLRRPAAELDTIEDELARSSKINALGMVGRSRALHALVSQVERLRKFQSRFLIIGASGTGKELIARAFAKGKSFHAVDCAEFGSNGEQFIESQLFGRKKGAYTGADTDLVGAFEHASGGVMFLDELHCLSLGSQAKLLRTLQEQKFRRLGDPSGREIELNALVVAATQPLIYDMLENGTFKQDLFYRIAKQKLHIPALNERPDDIRPLAEHFFRVYSRAHKIEREPHPQLLRDLESYSWPGSVRELEGCVESMIMNSNELLVMPGAFGLWIADQRRPTATEALPAFNLELIKDSVEIEKIVGALELSLTIAEAALRLQIARTTLNDRIRRLGIQSKSALGRQLKRQVAHA